MFRFARTLVAVSLLCCGSSPLPPTVAQVWAQESPEGPTVSVLRTLPQFERPADLRPDVTETPQLRRPDTDLMLVQNAASTPSSPAAPSTGVRQADFVKQVSDAERITGLKRAIEADQHALQAIEANLADPGSEYHTAEAEFKQLDARMEELKRSLEEAKRSVEEAKRSVEEAKRSVEEAKRSVEEAKRSVEEAKKARDPAGGAPAGDVPQLEDKARQLQLEIDQLQPKWKLAKDRFDLAIQERKTVQEKAATLKQKVQQEQATLDKLTGESPNSNAASEPPSGAPTTPNSPVTQPTANPNTPSAAAPLPAPLSPLVPTLPVAAPTPVAAPVANNGAPSAATPATTPEAAPAPAAPAAQPDKPASKELVKATEDADKKEAAAKEAEQQVQSVIERMELLSKEIQLEQQLLATARKKADIALETERQLQEEYQNKLRAGTDLAAATELYQKVTQAKERFTGARAESRERVNRLDELQSRYAALQSEQIVKLQEAERARLAAETAKSKVAALRNPFTAHNIAQWMIDHGPPVAAILVVMMAALWLTRVADRRIIDAMVKRGGLARRIERENRARTLVGVFHNAANVAIVSGGLFMILDTIGAPIAALMGGAAVVGLAVAFGAQSLIKDFFYGFMILLEQQYTINDVIRIGDISGQVERISLRMTVLRDLEGRVHFIPHGAITSTTNMTHGWSRALFEIGVAYKEDADAVIELITRLGRQMREDDYYGTLILEDLTMLGVDAFADSAVVIKFFIKTRPLKQWEVKREMLRRIKQAFDEQGIEIPFPHRTVYHRNVGGESLRDSAEDALTPHRKSA